MIRFATDKDIPILKKMWNEIFGDEYQYIDMFFDTSSSCNSSSDFYIEIEEQKNEDEQLTSFQFDSLIIFLEE